MSFHIPIDGSYNPKKPPIWDPIPKPEELKRQRKGSPCALVILNMYRHLEKHGEQKWIQLGPLVQESYRKNTTDFFRIRKNTNGRFAYTQKLASEGQKNEILYRLAVLTGDQLWFPGWFQSIDVDHWRFLVPPTQRLEYLLTKLYFSDRSFGDGCLECKKNGAPLVLKDWSKMICDGRAQSVLENLERQHCDNPSSIAFTMLHLSKEGLCRLLECFGNKEPVGRKFLAEKLVTTLQKRNYHLQSAPIQKANYLKENPPCDLRKNPTPKALSEPIKNSSKSRASWSQVFFLLLQSKLARCTIAVLLVGVLYGGIRLFTSDEIREVAKTKPDIAANMYAVSPKALLSKASAQLLAGNVEEAESTVNLVFSHPEAKDYHKGTAFYYKGRVKYNSGQFHEALYFQSLYHERFKHLPGAEASIYASFIEMARAQLRLCDFPSAKKNLNRAYEILETIPDNQELLIRWYDLNGQVALGLDDRESLLDLCQKRLQLVKNGDDKIQKAGAYGWLGYAFALNGKLPEAIIATTDAQTFVDDLEFRRLRQYHNLNWIVIRRFKGQDPTLLVQQIERYLKTHQDFDLDYLLEHAVNVKPYSEGGGS